MRDSSNNLLLSVSALSLSQRGRGAGARGGGGGGGWRGEAFSGKPRSSAQPPGRPEKVSGGKGRNSIEKSTQVSEIRPNKLLLRVCRKVTSLDSESECSLITCGSSDNSPLGTSDRSVAYLLLAIAYLPSAAPRPWRFSGAVWIQSQVSRLSTKKNVVMCC